MFFALIKRLKHGILKYKRGEDMLEDKIKMLPDSPGVYIMKNNEGKTIYVGKAKVLKNRVKQYFTQSSNRCAKNKNSCSTEQLFFISA